MHSVMKKVLASVLVAALAVSTPVVSTSVQAEETGSIVITPKPKKQEKVDVEPLKNPNSKATVDTTNKGKAAIDSIENKVDTRIILPKTVKVKDDGSNKNVKYTVTALNKNALKNAKKAEYVSVPDTVTTVKKGAFSGAKKLKKIRFNAKAKVEKGAFKGLKTKNMTIVVKKNVSKKDFKKFKKALKKAGFKGKIFKSKTK